MEWTARLSRFYRHAAAVSPLQEYGPLALALFLLATSRWGSYLFPGPPYIADIVLALLLIDRAFAAATRRLPDRGVDPWLGISGGLLLTWSAIHLLFSPLTEDAFRDATPYFYAVIVFLVAAPSPRAERVVSGAVIAALVFHAAWVTLSALAPSPLPLAPSLGGGQAYVFQVRPDFDSAVCGLLAVIALNRALLRQSPILSLALAGWGTALAFALETRGGLLAFLAQLMVLIALRPARARMKGGTGRRPSSLAAMRQALARGLNRRIVVAVLVVLLPVAALAASDAASVTRLTNAIGLSEPAASEAESAEAGIGTARARLAAWGRLIEWITEDLGQNLRGVGVGTNFLKESGAAKLLLGDHPPFESRHPHNYFLNTWARLGLFGLALTLAMMAAAVRLAVLVVRRSPALRDPDVLAIMLVASLPTVAAVGVILESPFGVIPYFWALGHLSARACQLRATTPLATLSTRARSRVKPGSRAPRLRV